jgi:hypothetical protein
MATAIEAPEMGLPPRPDKSPGRGHPRRSAGFGAYEDDGESWSGLTHLVRPTLSWSPSGPVLAVSETSPSLRPRRDTSGLARKSDAGLTPIRAWELR